MATLRISFQGLCSHFTNVGGVPHRVVLPDARRVHFGTLQEVASAELDHLDYCLMPHFPFLVATPAVNVGRLVEKGLVRTPVVLQLLNATGPQIHYHTSYADEVKPLTRYVADYVPSEEVVLGARAACRLDLSAGCIEASAAANGAVRVAITVSTCGAPQFSVTPLRGAGVPELLTLSDPDSEDVYRLEVSNLEPSGTGSGDWDFLLHYLTGVGGIPQRLTEMLPGMLQPLTPLDGPEVAKQLRTLADWAEQGWPHYPLAPGHDSPSCSDSRYP